MQVSLILSLGHVIATGWSAAECGISERGETEGAERGRDLAGDQSAVQ